MRLGRYTDRRCLMVTYKSLDFLGFPDHRVGDDGSVWSIIGVHNKIPHETRLRIKAEKVDSGISYQKLANKYGYNISTVFKMCKTPTELKKWRRIKPATTSNCHLTLYHNKVSKTFSVSRLVLLAFRGPCPVGMEACHFPDRSIHNNRLVNLRWDTPLNNSNDKRIHGTIINGEDIPWSKLTDGKVRIIRKLLEKGSATRKQLAIRFGVCLGTIRLVHVGKNWKHVL